MVFFLGTPQKYLQAQILELVHIQVIAQVAPSPIAVVSSAA
jgi:hypothetical protein